MGKTITFGENRLLTLKDRINEIMVGMDDVSHNGVSHNVEEVSADVDEFELGQESDNPPVGGNSFHVNENKYDDLLNKSITDLENFRKQGAEKYGEQNWYAFSWMERMHPETKIDPNDIKIYNALLKKTEEASKLWNNEDNNESALEATKETDYDIISLAIEHYGTTSNLGQAGYILPDGRLLNFGNNGYREEDHRGIEGIYKKNNIPIWSDEYRYNYVVDFMNHGAIRCCLNGGILDMTKEPTKEQYFTIRTFVRKAADVDIDFTDNKGNTLHSASYSDAKPQQVVADIMRYYEEGIKPQGNVQYESKKNNKSVIVNESQIKNIIENLDFEVDSSDIDLSSFKKKSELAPIWVDDNTLDSRVRLRLLDIADDFWEFVNLTWVKPSGIVLTGSICNFNWSKYSDIDLHLIVDFDEIDEKTEFVRDYLDAKKNEWNNEHSDLTILGFPVELYVQNLGEMPQSGGIYDLEENDWIKKPDMDNIKPIGLDKFPIKDKAAEIMTIIDDMYNAINSTDDSHKIETIGDDAQYLWKKVKAMRKASLESNGESGAGNIVYKILRRTQYLDKLFRLFSVVYDRNNSITESVENNNNVDVFALAKERFGVTNDIRECGYILPDGSMLDFSGRHMVTGNTDTSHLRGRRGVDHRDIGNLNWDADMSTKSGLNINMADFIRMGAIRIHCSNTWSSINLFKKPTREQVNPMLRLIQYSKGNVTVEIGDGDNSYEYAEWDEANPRRVVNDVIRYFDGETINLVGNVTESKELINEWDKIDYFEKAKQYFGTTNDLNECGFILPNGEMLDLSSVKGRRGIPHRNVEAIGVGLEIFIEHGAIRCDSRYKLINICKKPTKEQINRLVEIIKANDGSISLDLGNGHVTFDYVDYKNVNYKRIINDILNFFDNKIKPSSLYESKNIIKEYLEKDYNLPLYKYFKWAANATDFEKVQDLVYQCSYETKQYIAKMARQIEGFEPLRLELIKDEDIIYDDEFVENIANIIVNNNLTDAFIYYLQTVSDPYELPSWLFMDFNRVVKNEWCIHFGADSYSIAREGFTGGTEEIEHLAYTGAGRQKSGAGYDFAFPLGERAIDNNEYGDEAVIFQTSGIEVYHSGDSQKQVVFWGPNAKNFIPIKYNRNVSEWCIYGMNDQVLKSGEPSEILNWVLNNLPQYRKQIMAGKNGYIPKYYDYNQRKRVPYPIYRNESIQKYITSLKEEMINEEWVGDGNSEHNPYKKRWDAERKALKDFVSNYGKLMQSKENGKLYKCYYDKVLSQLIGYNYCICIQWDSIEMKPKSVLYIRALDKFTPNIKQVNFDTRGKDNQMGTVDDKFSTVPQQTQYQYQ